MEAMKGSIFQAAELAGALEDEAAAEDVAERPRRLLIERAYLGGDFAQVGQRRSSGT